MPRRASTSSSPGARCSATPATGSRWSGCTCAAPAPTPAVASPAARARTPPARSSGICVAGERSEAEPQPPGLPATPPTERDPAPGPDADLAWAVRIEAAAIIAFSVMWVAVMFLAERGLYGSPQSALEVNLYRGYAENVLAGQVPYRDFALEYPPLALVPILGPLLLAGSPLTETGYRVAFELFMAGIGMVTMIFVMRAAGSLDLGRRGMLAAAALVAASPLLLGPLMLARYDLWPALFAAATMWLFIVGRHRLSAIALGLAVLAKVYPIVLAPLL